MRLFCIGRNYAAHIEELQNERPTDPVIFMKPDTAILKDNVPFYYPDFSQDIHHEVEIVLKISKQGKNLDAAFAHRYYEEIGVGIDFTARDLQARQKAKGLPWEIAKGFDGSAPISGFVPKSRFADLKNLDFSLTVNGDERQRGNTALMLWSFNEQIAYLSRFFTLRPGDLLFTGTPEGVGPVQVGDVLAASLEGEEMLRFEVK
jgi:2-keto-4-pentenoate hydratase/2-oxohepta-3-ene-1,7-dioic acid hydratase in catechol pathway